MSKSLIYTRTGDAGTTSLVGGKRAPKDSTRLEAYGTIDELNSHLGLLAAMAAPVDSSQRELLTAVQSRLFDVGGYLATDSATECRGLSDADVARLEDAIDAIDSRLVPLRSFVLPAGCAAAGECHVCRTVCRRAERRVVALMHEGVEIDPRVLRYLNRLSDYLFVFARLLNQDAGIEEVPWKPSK